MARCGVLAFGVELVPEFSYVVIVKLLSIIRDYSMWNPKPADDLFPNEASSGFLSDFGERLGFDLPCEVVDHHNCKFILTRA